MKNQLNSNILIFDFELFLIIESHDYMTIQPLYFDGLILMIISKKYIKINNENSLITKRNLFVLFVIKI